MAIKIVNKLQEFRVCREFNRELYNSWDLFVHTNNIDAYQKYIHVVRSTTASSACHLHLHTANIPFLKICHYWSLQYIEFIDMSIMPYYVK